MAALAAGALTLAACSGGGGSTSRDLTGSNLASNNVQAPSNPAPPQYGSKLSSDLKVGYVTSSGGPGAAFELTANGGHVIAKLIHNDNAKVTVQYADDLGSDSGSTAAVEKLINNGATVIVYGSAGPQVDAGVKAAAARNVAVILPYDTNAAVASSNSNAFSTALTNSQVSDKLVEYGTKEQNYRRFAIVYDSTDSLATPSKDAFIAELSKSGRSPVAQLSVGGPDTTPSEGETPADEAAQEQPQDQELSTSEGESLRTQLIAVGDSKPDVLAVFGSANFVFDVAVEWHTTGLSAAWMISPRAAVPQLGLFDANAFAPPLRSPLSTGIAGGPWIQTVPVLNYFSTRDQVKKDSIADLSVADVISADAGLIAVAAAEAAGSSDGSKIMSELSSLSFDGIGAKYAFKGSQGVTLDDYAIVGYNSETSSENTYVGKQYPSVKTNGGFFVGLEGTAPMLQNINPFE